MAYGPQSLTYLLCGSHGEACRPLSSGIECLVGGMEGWLCEAMMIEQDPDHVGPVKLQ